MTSLGTHVPQVGCENKLRYIALGPATYRHRFKLADLKWKYVGTAWINDSILDVQDHRLKEVKAMRGVRVSQVWTQREGVML